MPRPTRPRHRESRPVGSVVAVTPSGLLTVRAPGAHFVVEGSEVADPSGRLRGRVVRVFGPVDRPYLSVRPRRALSAPDALALIGQSLSTQGELQDGTD